jgi:hypothetical protein
MNDELDPFDDFMRDMVQEAGLEHAPSNFTQSVMGQIAAQGAAKPPRQWAPLISKTGWIGIAASVVAAVLASVVMLKPNGKTSTIAVGAEKAIGSFVGFFDNLEFPLLLVTSVAAIALLVALDRILSGRRDSMR